jgi:osmotically-inducible protein OsmY
VADDAALAKEANNALLRDPYVSRFDMNILVNGGKVNLEGKVDSAFEKNCAEFVASRVHGSSTCKIV